MVIHEITKTHIPKFWDDAYTKLDYTREPFNDPESVNKWINQGFSGPFTGLMCDMKKPQPEWTHKFIEIFEARGWKNLGICYYRMDSGIILPNHSDLYKKYVQLFKLEGNEHWIHRAVVYMEDWKSGHYAEANGEPIVNWKAGDCTIWRYDTPHIAANLGDLPRYTVQITGHI